NVGGGTLEDYLLGVQMLNDKPVDIIELNISCPNVKAGGMAFGREERFDESKLAQQTANILGCKNSRYIITPEEYFASVPYVMYHM
ncbi:hypothetical protein ACTPEM_23835, partial [Clostridioides difficile]